MIPIGGAIGRIACGLDGVDYGTPTSLLRLRGKLPDGALFLVYLVLFSVFRFFLFFVRGSSPDVALGLKNAQWTAIAILIVTVPLLVARLHRRQLTS